MIFHYNTVNICVEVQINGCIYIMHIVKDLNTQYLDNDAFLIRRLLAGGIGIIHLRKPDSDIDECRQLLRALTAEERSKIIVHDYPELYYEFSLKGIHINRNVPALPDGYKGFRTRSCHSFEEVVKYKDECDYLFLSPIFDSISKTGYRAAFTSEQLRRASIDGIIDSKVVALGGVTYASIPYLEQLNFGGAAMIGGIYDINLLDNLKYIQPHEKEIP